MAKRKRSASSEPTFEARLERLDEIVETLEGGEAGLDESLKLYTEGADLVKACRKTLEAAEKKIARLTESAAGDLVETPVDAETLDEAAEED